LRQSLVGSRGYTELGNCEEFILRGAKLEASLSLPAEEQS